MNDSSLLSGEWEGFWGVNKKTRAPCVAKASCPSHRRFPNAAIGMAQHNGGQWRPCTPVCATRARLLAAARGVRALPRRARQKPHPVCASRERGRTKALARIRGHATNTSLSHKTARGPSASRQSHNKPSARSQNRPRSESGKSAGPKTAASHSTEQRRKALALERCATSTLPCRRPRRRFKMSSRRSPCSRCGRQGLGEADAQGVCAQGAIDTGRSRVVCVWPFCVASPAISSHLLPLGRAAHLSSFPSGVGWAFRTLWCTLSAPDCNLCILIARCPLAPTQTPSSCQNRLPRPPASASRAPTRTSS